MAAGQTDTVLFPFANRIIHSYYYHSQESCLHA